MAYKVIMVNQSGCNGNISPEKIEEACDSMASQGFTLKEAYLDASVSCCGPKKHTTLIFSQ